MNPRSRYGFKKINYLKIEKMHLLLFFLCFYDEEIWRFFMTYVSNEKQTFWIHLIADDILLKG